jgi:putative FmdB family regulatory protein
VPTYVYACKNCGHRFEKYQSFSEDSLTLCPQCHAEALRKVFDSVGIVFKGSGFYSTDSASSKTAASGSTSAGDGGGDSAASTSESSTTSETPSPAGAGAGGDASAAASA